MRKVFKYPLKLHLDSGIFLPEGAEILTVDKQGEDWFLWALVDPLKPVVHRKVEKYGTGWDITEENLKYICTVKEQHEMYFWVWHFFELL